MGWLSNKFHAFLRLFSSESRPHQCSLFIHEHKIVFNRSKTCDKLDQLTSEIDPKWYPKFGLSNAEFKCIIDEGLKALTRDGFSLITAYKTSKNHIDIRCIRIDLCLDAVREAYFKEKIFKDYLDFYRSILIDEFTGCTIKTYMYIYKNWISHYHNLFKPIDPVNVIKILKLTQNLLNSDGHVFIYFIEKDIIHIYEAISRNDRSLRVVDNAMKQFSSITGCNLPPA